jgi:hypothetical protein
MTELARRILIFEFDSALLAFRFLNILSLCFLIKERTSFSKICASFHTTPSSQRESADEGNAFPFELVQNIRNSVTMLTLTSKKSNRGYLTSHTNFYGPFRNSGLGKITCMTKGTR